MIDDIIEYKVMQMKEHIRMVTAVDTREMVDRQTAHRGSAVSTSTRKLFHNMQNLSH